MNGPVDEVLQRIADELRAGTISSEAALAELRAMTSDEDEKEE